MTSTSKWLAEIVLGLASGCLGALGLMYVYAGLGAINWHPGLHQIHPLVWGGSLVGSVILLYMACISLKSAKRGGKWGWR